MQDVHTCAPERNKFLQHPDPPPQRAEHVPAPSTGAASCLRAGEDTDIDWRQVALAAWEAPGWREAALDYHRERSPSPPLAASRLVTPEREIWRAAGHCIRRKAAHGALRTFLGWCDRHGVSRSDALPIFKIIVDKELAK